jgi:CheY-like chemotaxis protein
LLTPDVVNGKAASMSELPTATHTDVRSRTRAVSHGVRPHALIAAGDPDTRVARETQLRAAGFRVSVARTGFEAIVKASCHVPDLILLDESLTDLDAPETARLLTTCPVTAHIPVIQLAAGRRMPRRRLTELRRASAVL